ncbi:hypothetical protein H9L15_15125 [Sphingomonas daechungensis]|uniref:Uncharacterized protein n=1 Tax=Sphingomonas daechungensis TaxID=1176646 RepID=A0ABX6T2V3_9SPHN|nr:hypothetical protein [Sphingomonas daechungensis]QNP43227.1 hypothetical protein H9L15_15125 [Sphingomonas daechungensis]
MRNRLLFATGIVIVMCAASLILVDSMHNRLAASAQVFRMLMVVKWAGFLLFGAVASRWLGTGRPLLVAAPFLVLLSTGEAQPYVMLAATTLALAAERWSVGKRTEIVLTVLLALFAFYETMHIGSREEVVRAALAGMSIGLLYMSPLVLPVAAGLAISAAIALIAFGWVNRSLQISHRGIFNPTYQWSDLKTDDADIARWAKVNTPAGAVWITPRSSRLSVLSRSGPSSWISPASRCRNSPCANGAGGSATSTEMSPVAVSSRSTPWTRTIGR